MAPSYFLWLLWRTFEEKEAILTQNGLRCHRCSNCIWPPCTESCYRVWVFFLCSDTKVSLILDKELYLLDFKSSCEGVGPRSRAGFPWWLSHKESNCQCRRRRFNPWVMKISWGRKWQSTPVLMPEHSMNRETWQVTVHAVAKSQMWLSD